MRSLSLILLLISSTAAAAQSAPPDLADMVGARAGQAENELGRRGYRFIRAERGDDRSYTFWWNGARRQCAIIATREGRYDSITAAPAPDCRQAASPPPVPPALPPVQRPPTSGGYDPGFSAVPVVVDGQGVQLALVCFGDGTKAGVSTSSGWRWNSRKEQYEREYRNQTTTEHFDTSLMLQLWAGGGRVRLPRSLIPPINSRGDNGWWELRDVAVGPDIIRANYRLNGLNRPRLTVDRRTGRITVQGSANYGFVGTCDEIGREQRRF